MKLLIKPLMLLFLFISTVATSCSGDDDNNQDQNPSANSFFCKVDGADFNPQFVSGFNSTGVSNTILLSASINASATQTTGINIFVPNKTLSDATNFQSHLLFSSCSVHKICQKN